MVNKTIAMTIDSIEKSSSSFKKTHKIKVSGPYDDEQMPKWFEHWSENVYENQPPKWFEKWEKEKFDQLVKRIDNIVAKNNLKE